jgi:hypothetical protein
MPGVYDIPEGHRVLEGGAFVEQPDCCGADKQGEVQADEREDPKQLVIDFIVVI